MQGTVHVGREPRPALPAFSHDCEGSRRTLCEYFVTRQTVDVGIAGLAEPGLTREVGFERIEQRKLVGKRELDIDALDRIRVFAEPLERDHDVFVDLERVRVAGNRGRLAAIAPERLACLGADRGEPLAGTCVGDAHDIRCAQRDGVFVGAHDIADQDHLR